MTVVTAEEKEEEAEQNRLCFKDTRQKSVRLAFYGDRAYPVETFYWHVSCEEAIAS